MKVVRSVLCFVLIIPLLSGCWDKKELEELAYATAIGLDLPEQADYKKTQAVEVTFQFSNPKLNIKEAIISGPEAGKDAISIIAPDFVTAKNTANSFVTRQISFSHIKAIIVSEKFAKNDLFFRFLATTLKEREMRRETSLIVSKGKAFEFMAKNKPEMMIRPHKYYPFIINRAVETGTVPESTINRFFAITDGDADLFLAIYGDVNKRREKNNFQEEDQYLAGHVPQKGGNPIQLMGSAVFKDGKMIGKLTGEETRSCLLLDNTSKMKDMYVSYNDPIQPKYKLAVRLKKKTKTKINIQLKKGPPNINVIVPVEVEILSNPSMENYSEDVSKQKLLKKEIEKSIKQKIEKLVEKTQKKFKSEPFYWSLYVRPLFFSAKDYWKWDWVHKNYPYAHISIGVNVEITGFGKQLKESEMQKVRD